MADIPDAVRHEIVVELYKRLDEMQWEQFSSSESTAAYQRFVSDPAVGGRLGTYMPRGQIRVWIKDGPAKEYRRALEGVGRYAPFTSRQYPGPQSIIDGSIGSGWLVRLESLDHKPMRCQAAKGDEVRFVTWGAFANLKELIWTGAVHIASGSAIGFDVVVTKPSIAPLPPDDWRFVRDLCGVIGAVPHQVTNAARRKQVWSAPVFKD
ncbi:hypothetical protein [Oerskovia paurometabola]|uniref:Uncharacterized protein n=1 Tax=Oerskovia paurometabola TaxID=162170 RepID=A0ABW1X666_9CELL|nr:hypothetical protein [Oerskovia paurometabola]MBM7495720.1 hypothetical protein [Oerskovia paurometabola]